MLWQKSQHRPPVLPINPPCRIETRPNDPTRELSRGQGNWRGRGGGRIESSPKERLAITASTSQNRIESSSKKRLAITASASQNPPRPCRFCGGTHWDRDCTYYKPNATAYHCYQVETTEEEYAQMEEEYEYLQAQAFAMSNQDNNGDENTSFRTTSTFSPSKTSLSIKETKYNAFTRSIWFVHNNIHECDQCHSSFDSRNHLLEHLQQINHYVSKSVEVPESEIMIVASTASVKDVAFRDCNYCEIKYTFEVNNKKP